MNTTKSVDAKWFSLETLTLLVAFCFALGYLVLAARRILYPYDLDFIEDNMLMQALRVSLGQPVYLAPNADFVPQVYMPLYTWLGGEIFKISGVSYVPLRLLSFGATMLSATIIFWTSKRISGETRLALVASALFLAGYRTTGGWYELVRVDALFVALLLGGAALAVYAGESRWRLVAAGTVLGLALLTKQNALFFAGVIALYLLITKKPVWLFAPAFILVAGIPILLLNQTSDGWFSFYVFKVAYLSPVDPARIGAALQADIFGSMAGLTIPFMVAGIGLLRRERWRGLLAEPWNWFIAAALFISLAGRASVGGNRNNLMPAYAFLCIAPALAAQEMRRWGARWQVRARGVLSALILLQFALTSFVSKYPAPFTPTSAMKDAGDNLIAHIARVDGPVLVLMHPYYALLAGKQPSADIQMLWHARLRGAESLPQDFVTRIQNHFYSEIISDGSAFETEPALAALLQKYYQLLQTVPFDESPLTLSGLITRPRQIYVPKQ